MIAIGTSITCSYLNYIQIIYDGIALHYPIVILSFPIFCELKFIIKMRYQISRFLQLFLILVSFPIL